MSIKLKPWAVNLMLFTASLLMTSLVLEGALRYRAYNMDSKLISHKKIVLKNFNSDGYTNQTSEFGFMTQLSKHSGIIYELKPHLEMEHKGVIVKTNSLGFRGKHYSWEKDKNTVRIFGIGDSIMFGQGIKQGTDYISRLEAELNKLHPQKNWEAINSGVPEYNTALEVETLRLKGLKFKPDIVVLGFCSNDIELPSIAKILGMPDELDIKERYFTLTRSYLVHFISQKMDFIKDDFTILPNKYGSLAGGKAVYKSMVELEYLSETNNFEVIALVFEPVEGLRHKAFIQAARSMGFHVVNVIPTIQKYMKDNGITQYSNSELTVPDGHPSSLAHKIASDEIVEYLRSSGLLDKLSK